MTYWQSNPKEQRFGCDLHINQSQISRNKEKKITNLFDTQEFNIFCFGKKNNKGSVTCKQ